MGYRHGVYTSEAATSQVPFVTATAPIFIVGTAPINMGDITNVNRAQLIMNPAEAAKHFGGIIQVKGDNPFSISELFDACFNYHNAAPIIAVNVLDPQKHHTTENLTEIAVVEASIKLNRLGVLLDTIEVRKNSTSEAVTFTSYFETDGKVIIELDDEAVTSVDIDYNYLDTTKVTKLDIIGGIDPNTLEKEGFECISDVFPLYSMIPSVIIAPGYSHEPEVKAIMDTKAEKLNSKYGTMGIIDIPTNIEYGAAIAYKKENNIVSENLIIEYGKLKDGSKIFHHSSMSAALMQSIDADNRDIPYESPSNKNLKVQALVITDTEGNYKELNLDEDQANVLNANGISTAIRRSNGFVHWGNRTSLYQPGGSTDPKDVWIPSKRMFKYIANTLQLNTAQDVDDPMTTKKARSIKTNINIYLAGLTAQNFLYGARVEFLEEENPEANLNNGEFTWHIYMGTVIPGEVLHFILEYDSQYIKQALLVA